MTKKNYLETLKKCPGSLYFPLLIEYSYDPPNLGRELYSEMRVMHE